LPQPARAPVPFCRYGERLADIQSALNTLPTSIKDYGGRYLPIVPLVTRKAGGAVQLRPAGAPPSRDSVEWWQSPWLHPKGPIAGLRLDVLWEESRAKLGSMAHGTRRRDSRVSTTGTATARAKRPCRTIPNLPLSVYFLLLVVDVCRFLRAPLCHAVWSASMCLCCSFHRHH